ALRPAARNRARAAGGGALDGARRRLERRLAVAPRPTRGGDRSTGAADGGTDAAPRYDSHFPLDAGLSCADIAFGWALGAETQFLFRRRGSTGRGPPRIGDFLSAAPTRFPI